MPSAQLDFMATCGTFLAVWIHFMYKRAKLRIAMRVRVLRARTKVDGVLIGSVLVLLFFGSLLNMCGDIETNPGPTSGAKKDMKQTRLTSASRRESIEKERSADTPVSLPGIEDPTLKDVMTLIQNLTTNINCKFDDVKTNVGQLKEVCVGIQENMSVLKKDVESLKEDNVKLKRENESLCERMEMLERKTDDLEGRSRRNNLIFHGMHREKNETCQDLEERVQEMFVDKLELSQDVPFDRLHRLNSRPDSPIIGCCTLYKDKELVLKSRKKLQGSNIFINEDFSARVRDVRKKLVPYLKDAKKRNKNVTMVYDHLIIDGKKFYLEGEKLKMKK